MTGKDSQMKPGVQEPIRPKKATPAAAAATVTSCGCHRQYAEAVTAMMPESNDKLSVNAGGRLRGRLRW